MPLHAPQRFATRIALICCSLSLLFVPGGIINAFCNRPTVNEPYWNLPFFVSRIYLRRFFPPSLQPSPDPSSSRSSLYPIRSRSPNYRVVAKSLRRYGGNLRFWAFRVFRVPWNDYFRRMLNPHGNDLFERDNLCFNAKLNIVLSTLQFVNKYFGIRINQDKSACKLFNDYFF